MKEAKICITAAIIACLIIVSCAYAMPVQAEAAPVILENHYSKLVAVTAVTQLNTNLWIIECQDKNEMRWMFLDDERLEEGDILTLLMSRQNENEEDDKCIEYTYEGHSQTIEDFFKVMGWQ